MTPTYSPDAMRELLDDLYNTESRRILATLIRLLGDFDLAEDAMHDAFKVALEQWSQAGVPANPRTWLISTGRFKAIDRLRRQTRFESPLDDHVEQSVPDTYHVVAENADEVEDDRLRLVFTCCHPALSLEARVALTLREVCGLSTEAIAHAFLIHPSTLAQRIVRAKAKIHEAHIPYQVPSLAELPERLDAVLQVIYLVFNEGYAASSGDSLTRPALSDEAIRLGRLVLELLPQPETLGLLALMLLHESRRMARSSAQGDVIVLEAQDRSLWNRTLIAEGTQLVKRAFATSQVGKYALQAAIAALHSAAATVAETDWPQIVGLYTMLHQLTPSPVIALNHAVAVAMRDGPQAGLALIDEILLRGELSDYAPAYIARADLCRRLHRIAEAQATYQQALRLSQQQPERRFLEQRISDLAAHTPF